MYDHGIHIGYIHTGLYDSGGDQYIDGSIHKIVHDPFQFTLLHLAVGVCHIGTGNKL